MHSGYFPADGSVSQGGSGFGRERTGEWWFCNALALLSRPRAPLAACVPGRQKRLTCPVGEQSRGLRGSPQAASSLSGPSCLYASSKTSSALSSGSPPPSLSLFSPSSVLRFLPFPLTGSLTSLWRSFVPTAPGETRKSGQPFNFFSPALDDLHRIQPFSRLLSRSRRLSRPPILSCVPPPKASNHSRKTFIASSQSSQNSTK